MINFLVSDRQVVVVVAHVAEVEANLAAGLVANLAADLEADLEAEAEVEALRQPEVLYLPEVLKTGARKQLRRFSEVNRTATKCFVFCFVFKKKQQESAMTLNAFVDMGNRMNSPEPNKIPRTGLSPGNIVWERERFGPEHFVLDTLICMYIDASDS